MLKEIPSAHINADNFKAGKKKESEGKKGCWGGHSGVVR